MGIIKTRDKALVSLLLGLAVAFLITPDDIFGQFLQTLSPDSRCPLVIYRPCTLWTLHIPPIRMLVV